MQIFENNTPPINFNYRPARLHEYKSGWLIEYYCENPTTNKLNRKTIKVNLLVSRYKNKREARQHINNIVSNINIKLSKGWNPFFEHEDSRLYSNINDVFAIYMQEKEKESRKHTLRSYSSFVSIIKNYINKNHPGAYSGTINHNTIAQFMDYVYNNRNVGQTTYNNYIKMGRALWNWMIEKCYTKENPFEKIKTKPKQKKKRIMIDKKTRNVIIDYLKEKNPNYLTICKLVYYSLIRPNEIQEIRIGDIDLKNHFIKITGDIAKNHKQRFAALTPDLIDDLKKININQYPAEYFLFSEELKPGKNKVGDARFRKEWIKLRKCLKLQKEMQLYSFRDTGIFEMLKYGGIDDLTVMQHADHHSLEMTTIYANHYDPNLINTIYEKAPKF